MSDMQNEATMEDILASIRQIISDEDASESDGSPQPQSPEPPQTIKSEPVFHSHDDIDLSQKTASEAERLNIEAVLSEFAADTAVQSAPAEPEAPAPRQPAPTPQAQPSKDMSEMEVVDFTAPQDQPQQPVAPPPPEPKPDLLSAPANSGAVLSQDDPNYFIVSDTVEPSETTSIFPENADEVSMEFSNPSAPENTGPSEADIASALEDAANSQQFNTPAPQNDHEAADDKPSEGFVDFFQKPAEPPRKIDNPFLEADTSGTTTEPLPSAVEKHADIPLKNDSRGVQTDAAESVERNNREMHPEFAPLIEDNVSKAAATTIGQLFAELEVSGDKTIEAVIRELLRPLLKEWLDNNLASIVDEKVEAEIRRIARLAR